MGANRNLPHYPDDKMTIPQPRHSEPSANTEPGGRLRGMLPWMPGQLGKYAGALLDNPAYGCTS